MHCLLRRSFAHVGKTSPAPRSHFVAAKDLARTDLQRSPSLEHTRRRSRRTTITSIIFSCFQLSFLPSLRSHVRTPRPVLPQHTLVPLPKRAEFQHPPQFQNKLDAKPVILIFMPFDSQTRSSSSSSSSTSPTSCMHLSYCCSRVPPQTVNPR